MIVIPAGAQVHLALGYTDMRKGLDGLSTLIQEQLKKDPFSGHLFVFRGKNPSLLKILFWDGTGLCLFTKRIDRAKFMWPRATERAIRPVALGRKNHLFAGSDGGGHRWAVLCSLIETCKLNDVEPYAYLHDVLTRMVDGHPVNRLDELLPWNWVSAAPAADVV